jgi:hypothetical protein
MSRQKFTTEKNMSPVIEEPEREVHSDAGEVEAVQRHDEIHEREKDAISALRDAVMEQKKMISELQNHHAYRGGPPSSISDSFSHLTFYSDDEDSIDFDDMDHDLKDAIAAIRKEASQMDVVIALDQLATTKSELEAVAKALQVRCSEVEDLKAQLEEKEDRLASLELERDLFEADAHRVKDDMKKGMKQATGSDLRSTSASSSVSMSIPGSCSTDISQLDDAGSEDGKPPLVRRIAHETPQRKVSVFLPTVEPASREILVRPDFAPRCEPQSRTGRFSPAPSIDVAKQFMERSPPNFRTRPQVPSRSRNAKDDDDILFQNQVLAERAKNAKANRNIKKLFAVDAGAGTPRRARTESDEESRTPSLFRRRFSGQRASRPKDDQDALLRAQVEAMKERLQASTHTSEELRKRLAMISRYYENIIRSLQENVASLKAEKSRMEMDLTNQVSRIDHEKRAEIRKLETLLIQKEAELAKLQRERSRVLI